MQTLKQSLKTTFSSLLLISIIGCSSQHEYNEPTKITKLSEDINALNFNFKAEDDNDYRNTYCYDEARKIHNEGTTVKYKDLTFSCELSFGGAWVEESILFKIGK